MFRLSNFYALLGLLLAVLLTACNAPASQTPLSVQPEAVGPQPAATPSATSASTQARPAVSPTFTPEADLPQVEIAPKWITYIGLDGNVWLLDLGGGEMEQLTQDGTPWGTISDPKAEIVQYSTPKWSSDGQLLAFDRSFGKPVSTGFEFENSLVVYDMNTRQTRAVIQGLQLAGFAWRPGTHQIAYGLSSDPGYFTGRGKVASELAKGIWVVDADSGAVSELVKPEKGIHLVAPQFTPDGQTVSFDELLFMEGRGNFAYYDLETQRYIRWEKPIGSYRWSLDGQSIFYDYMTYAPSGSERIYRNTRDNTAEQQISALEASANTIAYGPVLSPAGDQIAYIVGQNPMEQAGDVQPASRLYLQSIQSGASRDFGSFDQPDSLSWSPDGQSLVLEVGSYEARQLVLVSLADGSSRLLVQGRFPAWRP